MNRTIELSLSAEMLAEWNNECSKVLGYLCQWAIHSERYRYLTIHSYRDGELGATYRAEQGGPVTYYIAAIRGSNGVYSTHS